MKTLRCTLIIFIGLLIVSACSTGKMAYRKGNYFDATMQAVQHLRLKPKSGKALETIKKSYPMALEYGQQKIDQLLLSDYSDKYVSVVEEYKQLNLLADEITRCPAALDAVKPVVYFNDQLNKAKELAATEQYNEGIRFLQSGLIDDARLAYSCFERVKKCKPNYPDIDKMLITAEDLGTLKVVVEQVPVNSLNYQVSTKVFYDRMFNFLKKSVEKKFISFYRPSDAEELRINPHHIIHMQFNDFSIGNIREREVVKEYTSDSIVVGTYTDAAGVKHDVKNVVKAALTTHEREILSKGLLGVEVIDYQTKEKIANRTFPGEFIWKNEWATYNGDQRALAPDALKLVQQKQTNPPSPQELFLLFSDPIFSNSSSFLGSFYRRK